MARLGGKGTRRGLLLLLLLLQQGVHRRRELFEPLLELGQFIDRMVLVVVMGVVALTGRLGLLSTAWFAGMPAAVGQRDDLLGVVQKRFADLCVEPRVVVVEVPEEVSQAWAGHDRAS